ncbi:MAG: type II secretion system F family protein [Ignisphaera sp.]
MAFSPLPLVIGFVIDFLRRRGITAVIDEDMLYLATHMYAVSTGKPPHERIFSLGSVSGKGYGKYTQVLNRIASLGRRWGYGFVIATKLQAKEVENVLFADFLNRLAEAINVGEDLETFLHIEHNTMLVSYEADYARVLEALKLLLGIYTASISSAIFIVINMVLLSFFFGGINMVITSFIGTMVALAALVVLIRRSLPRQAIVHDLKINMPEIRLYIYSLATSIAAASLVGFYTLVRFGQPAYFLVAYGLFLLIPGLIGRRIENKVKNIESFFTVFIRSLGLTYSTLRNYAQSVRSILASDLGLLTRHLRKLYARLRNGIDTRVAFLYFVGETGSETVRRGIDIFYDAIEAGGDPVKVGEALSTTIQRILNLRKQREQVARAFQGVVYILTILIVALAEFVFTLTLILQQVFAVAGGSVQIIPFTYIEPAIITAIKIGLVFTITILNAFALQFARGGYTGAAWLHASILLILSGATMVISSMFSQMLYQMIQLPQITP